MNNFISKNFSLKIISLGLALLSWTYIDNEITKSKEKENITLVWDKELNLEIRELPVRPDIKGIPPRGYVFVESQLMVNPKKVSVVGRKSVLDSIGHIDTEPVDIGKLTKTTLMKVNLHAVSNLIIPEGQVELVIPIEKLKRKR